MFTHMACICGLLNISSRHMNLGYNKIVLLA